MDNILETIWIGVEQFISAYNENHYSPACHSGKLFCMRLPYDVIAKLPADVDRNSGMARLLDGKKVNQNPGDKVLLMKNIMFKLISTPLSSGMIYEPKSMYDDGGIKPHTFKWCGRIVDNSVEIIFSYEN